MIELPAGIVPNNAEPQLIDFGFFQRPGSGAALLRVDRPGNRLLVRFSLPPMTADDARRVVPRLMRAKREGLRIVYPLLGVSQGYPGAAVVDGAGQAGTTLRLRGLTPHFACKEGFWLTVVDADGARCLHACAAPGIADADGALTIGVEPPLRVPLADGAPVELARPTVEGALPETLTWSLAIDLLVRGGDFVLEEVC